MSYFLYGSHRIYYDRQGTGKPLILLHGNTASGRMFAPLIPALSERYCVITMDFLGCGLSDRLPFWSSDLWYEWSREVYALCWHIGIGEVNIVGTSGGALAAVNAALEFPQIVRAAAADSFAGINADPGIVEQIRTDRAKAKQNERFCSYLRSIHGDDWEAVLDADTDAILRQAGQIGMYFHQPLSSLRVPLLLTGSEEDELFPKGHYQRLFQEICQQTSMADAHIFLHGSHPAMLSNSEEFIALLDRM